MIENLSEEQEQLLLAAIRDVSKNIADKEGELAHR